MQRQIHWGILGGGAIVRKNGPAFGPSSSSSVHAVFRRGIERARQSATELGAKRWYDTLDDLLCDSEIDAIYIATPPGTHRVQALACCRARKPVYVEKPLARSFEEASQIVEAFEKQGIPLFVAHYRRALPRFIELKRLLDSGAIGEVRDVQIRLTRRFGDDERHPWLFEPEVSGGGKFFDIAPHTIDLLVFLFGAFRNVHGVARTTPGSRGLEDVVALSFATTNNVLGTANFNMVSDEKADSLKIFGSLGSIATTIHGAEPMIVNTRSGVTVVDILDPPLAGGPMISEVAMSLLGGKASPCTGREALETYRIIDVVLSEFYGGRTGEFWETTQRPR